MIYKFQPTEALPAQPKTNEAALQWAAYAMQDGRATEAERAAGELLKKNPADVRAAYIYGHALYLQGRSQDAITPLERAVRRTHSPVLETQLGLLLRHLGRLDDALKHFERATKRQPAFPPAFLEYGSLLLELMRYNHAVEVLEHGLALAPGFAEILVHLGAAHAARGQKDKAIHYFSAALATAPNDQNTMYNFVRLMKTGCCFAQAADLFKRLLDVDPQDSSARLGLGVCLLELGETEVAFDHLSQVSRLDGRMFGQVLNAVASAGRGRFWLRPSLAERFLKRKG